VTDVGARPGGVRAAASGSAKSARQGVVPSRLAAVSFPRRSRTTTAATAFCIAVALAAGCGRDSINGPAGPGHSEGRWDLELAGALEDGHFGASLSIGPDADGDGLSDLLVGAPGVASVSGPAVRGRVFLFAGNRGSELREWEGASLTDGFGRCVALGPDVNGDGFADVAVGATSATDSGTVYLYSGLSGSRLRRWTTEDRGSLGGACMFGADADGDRFADLAVADYEVSYDPSDGEAVLSRRGKVRVYSSATGQVLWLLKSPRRDTAAFGGVLSFGSSEWSDGQLLVGLVGGQNNTMDVSLLSTDTGETLQEWSRDVSVSANARLGPDATGDGVADVVAAIDGNVELWSGVTGAVEATWDLGESQQVQIAYGPDATGDGLGDFVVAYRGVDNPQTTTVALFDSSAESAVGRWSLPSPRALVVELGPDMDGDGLGDFVVADDDYERQAGRVWVFLSGTATP